MARRPRSSADPLPDSFDPLEMALDIDRGDASPDSPARRLLRDQGRLVRIQISEARLSAALKVLTGLAGLAVAAVLGVMVWSAAHDRSLAITAFNTPPDMAARGLTGQVLAAQLMDKLAAIDAQATSFRAAATIRGDWGGDIKVEIPATGVSISELDRYLRGLLSHRTTIGGEVFAREKAKGDGGLALTVRAGDGVARTISGSEASLDDMLQQAAEAVFEQTQPFRYSKYLEKNGRIDEAMAVARRLADNGPPSEKPWAWAQISNLLELSDLKASADAARTALRLDPNLGLGWLNLYLAEGDQGHEEQALQADQHSVALLTRGGGGLSQTGITIGRFNQPQLLAEKGDYLGAATMLRGLGASQATYLGLDKRVGATLAYYLILNHDLAAARAVPEVMSDNALGEVFTGSGGIIATQYATAAETGDWAAAEAISRDSLAHARGLKTFHGDNAARVWILARLAVAVAHQGRAAEAAQLIADTPLDCAHCLVARGVVASLAGDRAGAAHWFAEAARLSPSLPWAQLEWGRMLLAAGDTDSAFTQLNVAVARASRYADVIELMGEALLAKGDAAGAAERFQAAAVLAPRWGRNRLMWGIALARAGKAEQAHAQWLAARGAGLVAADRAQVDHLLADGR